MRTIECVARQQEPHRTAEELQITVPTISALSRTFEESAWTDVLIRLPGSQGVRMNEAAARLVNAVRSLVPLIIEAFDEIGASARQAQNWGTRSPRSQEDFREAVERRAMARDRREAFPVPD